jgi:hypothetical protein
MQDDAQSAGKHHQPGNQRPEATTKRTAGDTEPEGTESLNRQEGSPSRVPVAMVLRCRFNTIRLPPLGAGSGVFGGIGRQRVVTGAGAAGIRVVLQLSAGRKGVYDN